LKISYLYYLLHNNNTFVLFSLPGTLDAVQNAELEEIMIDQQGLSAYRN